MEAYTMTVKDIEAELDEVLPTWDSVRPRTAGAYARGKPFDQLYITTLRRVKWLLKRRVQLLNGHHAFGVLIVDDISDPSRCYAHPVPPSRDGKPSRPEVPPKGDV